MIELFFSHVVSLLESIWFEMACYNVFIPIDSFVIMFFVSFHQVVEHEHMLLMFILLHAL